jgi:uncharacterized protein
MTSRTAIFGNVLTTTVLAMLLASVSAHAQIESPQLELNSFPQSGLSIHSAQGEQKFAIWTAATPQQQMQGLMFVRDLPADRGMLFTEQQPRVASMWMKNTYVPLDMLFIDARGKIVKIIAMTKPFSLEVLSSGVPIKAVLELRGGEAKRRHIHIGDVVIHATFKAKDKAKKPSAATVL